MHIRCIYVCINLNPYIDYISGVLSRNNTPWGYSSGIMPIPKSAQRPQVPSLPCPGPFIAIQLLWRNTRGFKTCKDQVASDSINHLSAAPNSMVVASDSAKTSCLIHRRRRNRTLLWRERSRRAMLLNISRIAYNTLTQKMRSEKLCANWIFVCFHSAFCFTHFLFST